MSGLEHAKMQEEKDQEAKTAQEKMDDIRRSALDSVSMGLDQASEAMVEILKKSTDSKGYNSAAQEIPFGIASRAASFANAVLDAKSAGEENPLSSALKATAMSEVETQLISGAGTLLTSLGVETAVPIITAVEGVASVSNILRPLTDRAAEGVTQLADDLERQRLEKSHHPEALTFTEFLKHLLIPKPSLVEIEVEARILSEQLKTPGIIADTRDAFSEKGKAAIQWVGERVQEADRMRELSPEYFTISIDQQGQNVNSQSQSETKKTSHKRSSHPGSKKSPEDTQPAPQKKAAVAANVTTPASTGSAPIEKPKIIPEKKISHKRAARPEPKKSEESSLKKQAPFFNTTISPESFALTASTLSQDSISQIFPGRMAASNIATDTSIASTPGYFQPTTTKPKLKFTLPPYTPPAFHYDPRIDQLKRPSVLDNVFVSINPPISTKHLDVRPSTLRKVNIPFLQTVQTLKTALSTGDKTTVAALLPELKHNINDHYVPQGNRSAYNATTHARVGLKRALGWKSNKNLHQKACKFFWEKDKKGDYLIADLDGRGPSLTSLNLLVESAENFLSRTPSAAPARAPKPNISRTTSATTHTTETPQPTSSAPAGNITHHSTDDVPPAPPSSNPSSSSGQSPGDEPPRPPQPPRDNTPSETTPPRETSSEDKDADKDEDTGQHPTGFGSFFSSYSMPSPVTSQSSINPNMEAFSSFATSPQSWIPPLFTKQNHDPVLKRICTKSLKETAQHARAGDKDFDTHFIQSLVENSRGLLPEARISLSRDLRSSLVSQINTCKTDLNHTADLLAGVPNSTAASKALSEKFRAYANGLEAQATFLGQLDNLEDIQAGRVAFQRDFDLGKITPEELSEGSRVLHDYVREASDIRTTDAQIKADRVEALHAGFRFFSKVAPFLPFGSAANKTISRHCLAGPEYLKIFDHASKVNSFLSSAITFSKIPWAKLATSLFSIGDAITTILSLFIDQPDQLAELSKQMAAFENNMNEKLKSISEKIEAHAENQRTLTLQTYYQLHRQGLENFEAIKDVQKAIETLQKAFDSARRADLESSRATDRQSIKTFREEKLLFSKKHWQSLWSTLKNQACDQARIIPSLSGNDSLTLSKDLISYIGPDDLFWHTNSLWFYYRHQRNILTPSDPVRKSAHRIINPNLWHHSVIDTLSLALIHHEDSDTNKPKLREGVQELISTGANYTKAIQTIHQDKLFWEKLVTNHQKSKAVLAKAMRKILIDHCIDPTAGISGIETVRAQLIKRREDRIKLNDHISAAKAFPLIQKFQALKTSADHLEKSIPGLMCTANLITLTTGVFCPPELLFVRSSERTPFPSPFDSLEDQIQKNPGQFTLFNDCRKKLASIWIDWALIAETFPTPKEQPVVTVTAFQKKTRQEYFNTHSALASGGKHYLSTLTTFRGWLVLNREVASLKITGGQAAMFSERKDIPLLDPTLEALGTALDQATTQYITLTTLLETIKTIPSLKAQMALCHVVSTISQLAISVLTDVPVLHGFLSVERAQDLAEITAIQAMSEDQVLEKYRADLSEDKKHPFIMGFIGKLKNSEAFKSALADVDADYQTLLNFLKWIYPSETALQTLVMTYLTHINSIGSVFETWISNKTSRPNLQEILFTEKPDTTQPVLDQFKITQTKELQDPLEEPLNQLRNFGEYFLSMKVTRPKILEVLRVPEAARASEEPEFAPSPESSESSELPFTSAASSMPFFSYSTPPEQYRSSERFVRLGMSGPICKIIDNTGAGDCGFHAIRIALEEQGRLDLSPLFTRENFIALVVDRWTHGDALEHALIKQILEKAGYPKNINAWKEAFKDKAPKKNWLAEEHFQFLSSHFKLKFHFYVRERDGTFNEFPPLGDITDFSFNPSAATTTFVSLVAVGPCFANETSHFETILVPQQKEPEVTPGM